MLYQSKLDKLVGERIAEYQDELLLRHKLEACFEQSDSLMPYGYPQSIYHPKSLHKLHKATQFRLKIDGVLSNGVPKVLSGDMVDGYLLGVYNPRMH